MFAHEQAIINRSLGSGDPGGVSTWLRSCPSSQQYSYLPGKQLG